MSPHAQLRSLRDFYLAASRAEMHDAYSALRAAGAATPQVPSWKDLEFAFNRLFVGPAAVPAPPYASVYLDAQPDLMGPTTLVVRQLYEALGLESPWKGSIPDDHLGLELDAYYRVSVAADSTGQAELREIQALLRYHLRSWVPLFHERLRRCEDAPVQILWLAALTERLVDDV